MALKSSFGFTNHGETANKVDLCNLRVTECYALKQDEPTQVVLDNKTCPLDRGEILKYMCTDLKKVSTDVEIQHPLQVQNGVQYVIKLDECLTTTSDTDSIYRTDEPIVGYLVIKHLKSGNVTNELIGEVVERLCSACKREDGTWRFDDLMRSALKPTVN